MNGFWVYCNAVSELTGNSRVIRHINIVQDCWMENREPEYCANRLWEMTPKIEYDEMGRPIFADK